MNLRDHSIAVIKANQTENGAFIASPSFPTYHYSWFRDGSYIANALDLIGERESSRHFFNWACWAIGLRRKAAERAIAAGRAGQTPDPSDLLDTRYTADGLPGDVQWFNNQLDGFGTLLWTIQQHVAISGQPMPADWAPAVALLADYLSALWRQPCADCWEEFPDKRHTATLAAIYGGLNSASSLLQEGRYAEEAAQIRQFVLDHGVVDGSAIKFIGSTWVDASLIHLSMPYRLLAPSDPIMHATVNRLENELLVPGGGIHRYVEDNYYGGGEWILLTAYLALHYIERGEIERAQNLRRWIERTANANLDLPEQVEGHLLKPDRLAGWIAQWGEPAIPLLWSHAAYLTLLHRLEAIERAAAYSQKSTHTGAAMSAGSPAGVNAPVDASRANT